ncbi:ParB/RepB/Spo0J family partition protein [Aestuariivita boseongensis]|uniref:ParB/RepB/Spo0J family partition protein n=1 Tax=Aestuariivita boseongensis TaxID=1470562 RepID=UPI00067FB583|nr:ParB N-terminal domain-containing protein [Aestuariivita boseongensis]
MSSDSAQAKPKPMTIKTAREKGLLIEEIPLDQIDPHFLVRDRLVQDEDEMASLKSSIKARGQQIPIEVARLSDNSDRFGLISGWRRFMALRELQEETGNPAFGVIRALVIAPGNAQDAYLAMIEENEIRVNLSFYERARIALRAVHEGVFPDTRKALQGLYASSTRSKRSKIGTFVSLVDRFDGVLQHPTAISEKLGLALARELVRDASFAERVSERLRKAPLRTPHEEARILTQALGSFGFPEEPQPEETRVVEPRPRHATAPARKEVIGSLRLQYRPESAAIKLSGDDVDDAFFEDLMEWIAKRLG